MDEELNREISRKIFHVSVGTIFTALIYFEIAKWWHFLILLVIGIFLSIYIKLSNKEIFPFTFLIKHFGRKNEYPGVGALTFIGGTFIASLLFEKNIAAASVIILAVGDAVSPIIGMKFGKTKTILSKTKLFEGFIAGSILAFFAAWPIIGNYKIAALAVVISMLAEFWDGTDFFDDNILIPLVAGTVMTIAMIYI